MFKALVAAACVAVIAIAGLLFWNAYEATGRAGAPDLCRDALARLDPMTAIGSEIAGIRGTLTECMVAGHITQADLDAHLESLRANLQPRPAARLP